MSCAHKVAGFWMHKHRLHTANKTARVLLLTTFPVENELDHRDWPIILHEFTQHPIILPSTYSLHFVKCSLNGTKVTGTKKFSLRS